MSTVAQTTLLPERRGPNGYSVIWNSPEMLINKLKVKETYKKKPALKASVPVCVCVSQARF